ncbi:MAG TPA: beta-galactosidase [Armatimonadota bacterium]|jgi:hypothetical protein
MRFLMLFLALIAAPVMSAETRDAVAGFSTPAGMSRLSQTLTHGQLDGTRVLWSPDGPGGHGAVVAECHLLSRGPDHVAYVAEGQWSLSALDRIEFQMRGDGRATHVYLALYDVNDHLALIGPNYGRPEFNGGSTEWRRFSVDLDGESAVDSANLDLARVNRIGFMVNDAGASDAYVARIAFADVTIVERSALLRARPTVFSPNGDGVADRVRLTFIAHDASKPHVRIVAAGGGEVAHPAFQRSGGLTWRAEWDGRDSAGKPLPEGEYRCEARPTENSECIAAAAPVKLIHAPRLRKARPVEGFFPIGAWFEGNPTGNGSPSDLAGAAAYYDASFANLADHGINTVAVANAPPGLREMILQTAERRGIRVILEIGELADLVASRADLNERDVRIAVRKVVDRLSRYPALLRYQIRDEPQGWMVPNWLIVKRALDDADPAHPAFSCFNDVPIMDSIFQQTRVNDAAYDYYPLSHVTPHGEMERYISKMDDIVAHARQRPLWMVVQAFGSTDPVAYPSRLPRPQELRLMTWLALSRGAKGVFFFIYQSEQGWTGMVDGKGRPMPIFDEVKRLSAELRREAPSMLSLTPTKPIASAEAGVDVRSFVDRGGAPHIIVVNRDLDSGRTARVSIRVARRPKAVIDIRRGVALATNYADGAVSVEARVEAGGGALLKVVPR